MATIDLNDYMIFLFVSCRITGVIFFNPILGRRNIPGIVKVGLAMGISLGAAYELLHVQVADYTAMEMLLSMFKEFAVGFAMGFIVQLFLSIFYIGGELMDLQMGLSMASLYDPTTNTQVSVTGNIITTMYTLLFFITNSHITLLGIAVKSFDVVPVGLSAISPKLGIYMIELFGFILVYAVQLALPVIVTQIVVEVAVGILMRVVPNINVFVVNLQVKMGVGILVIFSIIPVLVKYLEKLNMIMLSNIQEGLRFFM
jgi:flagellar biosynthetic protein FliR